MGVAGEVADEVADGLDAGISSLQQDTRLHYFSIETRNICKLLRGMGTLRFSYLIKLDFFFYVC